MPERPLLIYDGDCRFCNYSVDYARAATGSSIDFRPYQEVAGDYGDISEAEFQASIHLIQPDGGRCRGAEAAFRTLALGGYTGFWACCYDTLPLFAAISEALYRLTARHRGACYRVSRILFGPELRPGSVDGVSWLFLRLLGLVYLAAFASFTLQAPGLVGAEGIQSTARFLASVDATYGPEKYYLLPTLLWLDASDAMISGLGVAGGALSLLLFANRGTALCLPLLYLLYLSILGGAQLFMSYQWDVLLLECGFLAIFLPWRPKLVSWLYRWLLFRFMLQSGLVKWFSGDEAWRNLSALEYHFETQPLPTVLAWWVHRWPEFLLQSGVVFTLLVELLVPFMILLPRRPRMLAALLVCLLQVMIIATGSYNFFNLLTLGLCLLLFDDRALVSWLPAAGLEGHRRRLSGRGGRGASLLVGSVALVYLVQTSLILGYTTHRGSFPDAARQFLVALAPFHIANSLGPFAVMTRDRPEIIIEGSRDGREWLAYELPYKPGALDRPPQWATPHQPRLDWQLWFAALAPRESNPWLGGLMAGLLKGAAPVEALFEHNPFPEQPPQYIRATLYRYHFSDGETREQTGQWWVRERVGEFWPVTGWRLKVERESL